MENWLGLLKINVIRGINLAIRDVRSSDPYVIIRMGKQKLKTRVIKKNINPEWNEVLTLYITDPAIPIKMQVYDWDIFSLDDKMGDAEFDIRPFIEAVKKTNEENNNNNNNNNIKEGRIINRVNPSRENNLAEESLIKWENGKVNQNLFLRLRNVECGEIQIMLEWIHVPGSKGL